MSPLHPGLWLKADARRGQNGPRKLVKAPVSMARSRCKSDRRHGGERGRVGRERDEQTLQSASVGSKTRSAGCTKNVKTGTNH